MGMTSLGSICTAAPLRTAARPSRRPRTRRPPRRDPPPGVKKVCRLSAGGFRAAAVPATHNTSRLARSKRANEGVLKRKVLMCRSGGPSAASGGADTSDGGAEPPQAQRSRSHAGGHPVQRHPAICPYPTAAGSRHFCIVSSLQTPLAGVKRGSSWKSRASLLHVQGGSGGGSPAPRRGRKRGGASSGAPAGCSCA
jgi:hypothetical protein